MFDQIKQINELRKKSQHIQKELSLEVLEITHKGIKVQINGNLEIIELVTDQQPDPIVKEAINRALKETQKVVAQKMRGQLSGLGLNLPGL